MTAAGLLVLAGALACQPTPSPPPVADLEELVGRLADGGAVVAIDGRPVSNLHLSVEGLALGINGDRLQVFEYGDVARARMEFEALTGRGGRGLAFFDPGKGAAEAVTMGESARVYRSGRFITLYGGEDEGALGALEAALGPPAQRK